MADDPLIRRPGPIREHKMPIPSERYYRGLRALEVAIAVTLVAVLVLIGWLLWAWST